MPVREFSQINSSISVIDIGDSPAFSLRRSHLHDPSLLTTGMERLAVTLVENPEKLLQQLADCAIDLCGADSAGVSLVDRGPDREDRFKWIAAAGQFSRYINAFVPLQPSACAITLERNRPQLFQVGEAYFLANGMEPASITDGLLIPWRSGETQGTLWVAAHGRSDAFDRHDLDLMIALARFASLGVAQQELRDMQYDQWSRTASSAMGHVLARQIHQPLQTLAEAVFIAAQGKHSGSARDLADDLCRPLTTLTEVVDRLLGSPEVHSRPN